MTGAAVIRAGRFALPVVHLDNHLLIVEKPPNMPSQRDRSGDIDVLTASKQYIKAVYQKPGDVYLGLLHRLDRPVGGLMALARTSKAAARLSRAFAEHQVQKDYLAVVRGGFPGERTLEDWLVKDEQTGNVSVAPPGATGAKLARLTSAPLAEADGLTLLRVALHTGRPHQIRVQHAHAGHPLWGDQRYGDGQPGQQIALWAYSLAFEHPVQREPMKFLLRPEDRDVWRLFTKEITRLMES